MENEDRHGGCDIVCINMHLKADKLAQSKTINPLHRWFLKIINRAHPIAIRRLKMQSGKCDRGKISRVENARVDMQEQISFTAFIFQTKVVA